MSDAISQAIISHKPIGEILEPNDPQGIFEGCRIRRCGDFYL